MKSGGQEIRNERREFVVCCLVFVTLALVLLWPVARRPGWWVWTPGAAHSDLAVTHWPNAHFTRRALWEDGRFPSWRPTIMSGAPFAANPLAGLYYLPNWFFLFSPWLPLEVGFNLSALVHVWLAGAAMYVLLRRGLDVGAWGALAAAVVYEASPKLLAHLGAGHVGWVQAWGWLPVVMLCLVRMCECANLRVGGRWAVGAGAVLAIQFLADVRMAAYTLAAALALALAWMLGRGGKETRGQGDEGTRGQGDKETRGQGDKETGRRWGLGLGGLGLSLGVFLGLSACQWLPVVLLLSETTRAVMTLHDAAALSLPWQYLAGLLLANHGGFHEWMTYAGVSTLVLAGVGVGGVWQRREKRWLVVWLVGLPVGAAWFSLGENGGLFQVLWRIVPGLGLLRVPPRAWVLVVFALAVLVGLGVDEMTGRRGDGGTRGQGDKGTRGQEGGVTGRRSGRRVRRLRRALVLAVGAFPPSLVLGYGLSLGAPPLNLVMFGVVTPLAIVICNLRPRRTAQSTTHSTRWLGLAAVLLVAVDLLVVDVTLIEARSPEAVFAGGRAAAEWLSEQQGHFRIYSPSYSIPQHVAELYMLELADGVDPLQLGVYADYLIRAAGLEPRGYGVTLPPFPDAGDVRMALKDATPNAAMLGLLGVRYAAASFPIQDREWQLMGQFDEVYVYENRQARPLPEMSGAGSIVLTDGTTLFQYRPWPVYVGWMISGVTVVGVLGCWIARWLRGHWIKQVSLQRQLK